jgi:hypothetical protein
MSVLEQTAVAALIQQRVYAVTLAAALLVPTTFSPAVTFDEPTTGAKQTDNAGVIWPIHGSIEPSPVVPSFLPAQADSTENVATRLKAQTGLPVSLLATAAGVTRQAFYDWLDHKAISDDRKLRLHELERTLDVVANYVGRGDLLKEWLQRETDVGSPIQLLRARKNDVVIGLTLMRAATYVETSRGRVASLGRHRAASKGRRDEAYARYSITATEDYFDPSDTIEAEKILGFIRVE